LVPVTVSAVPRVEVLASGLDFAARWASVQVAITYASPGGTATTDTVELSAAAASAIWSRRVDGAGGETTARATYVSRQGSTIEQSLGTVTGDQIVVGDPLAHHQVHVSLVPAGTGWRDVALVMVDLRYADGAYVVDETVELRTLA